MKPGEITTTWEDGDQRPGYGIVVATSRHKDRLCLTEAATRLAAEAAVALVGRDVDHAPLYDLLSTRKTWFWHSVTKTEVEQDRHGCFAYCDPGGWCSEGSGQAWVEVLSVQNSEVYGMLDNPDLVTA